MKRKFAVREFPAGQLQADTVYCITAWLSISGEAGKRAGRAETRVTGIYSHILIIYSADARNFLPCAARKEINSMAVSTNASQICWPSRYWLKWLLVFMSSLIAGGVLAFVFKPKPQALIPPKPQYNYIFQAYDTQGRKVEADLIDPTNGGHSSLGDNPPVRKTYEAGVTKHYNFERTDVKPHEPLSNQSITWRAPADYILWLKGDFRDSLQATDSHWNHKEWDKLIKNFEGNSQSGILDYPVVFKARDAKKGKTL